MTANEDRSGKLKVAVLADRGQVQKFAQQALDALEGCDEISVFSCLNTRHSRQPFRHALYYALNLLAIRNPQTRLVPILQGRKPVAEFVEFECRYDGAWQSLPPEIVEKLRRFDVILKFGLGLLRVPSEDVLPVPILSWHHGDPELYRGRPAGFWEMFQGVPTMGQIVQVLSNRLDGGRVVAFAETKVYPHSYRATLIEAFGHSPFLLNRSVAAVLAGTTLPKGSNGRSYGLPSNTQVIRFCAVMALSWIRRLAYGAFVEKRWHVSTAVAEGEVAHVARGLTFPPVDGWRTLSASRPYIFYADPFFSLDPPGLLVEGLNARTGLGELVFVDPQDHRTVLRGKGHSSYPMTAQIAGRQLVIPETTGWAPPTCFVFEDERLRAYQTLRLEEAEAVLDPTLLEHDGRIYLFGNRSQSGANALLLWSSPSLDGVFRPHRQSPIRISPRGSRMAGAFVRVDGDLIRFGQDFQTGYGRGIFAFKVLELSENAYDEQLIGEIRFSDCHGPHTLNFDGGALTFDWYDERVSLMAGVRRLKAKLR